MALVDEGAGDRTGAGVQVLVAAPGGKVRSGRVQLERQVADRMGEIETGERAGRVRGARDVRQIEGLAGAVLHAGPEHQRDAARFVRQRGLDVGGLERVGARARRQLDQAASRVEPMPADLRFDGVAVRGKGAGLDQDGVAARGRAVEARQQQVQVDAQRIHRHDLVGACAGEQRQVGAQRLHIADPRAACLLVAEHTEAFPVLDILENARPHRAWCEAERVAAQVGQRCAAGSGWQREALAHPAQRIGGVGGPRELERILVGRARRAHGSSTRYSTGRDGTASPASAGSCSASR
jgi:hypothetical protein